MRGLAGVHEAELACIVPLLSSSNLEVRRCAVSMVANLIEVARECQEQVVELGALRLLMPLAAPGRAAPCASSVDQETQRESWRLLACLCENNYGEQVQAMASQSVQQLLANCDAIPDRRLRCRARRARDSLPRRHPM